MRPSTALAAAAAAALVAGACSLTETILPAQSTAASASSSGSSTSGCAAPELCAPSPPAGVGLFAIAEGNRACRDGAAATNLFAGLYAEEPICACSCGAPSGTCASPVDLAWSTTETGACAGADATVTLAAPAACVPLASAPRDASAKAESEPSCAPHLAQEIEPVQWARRYTACPLVAGATCNDSAACAPTPIAPFELCVLAPRGACPAAYPRFVDQVASGANDPRTCDACSCGSPCDVKVELFATPDCSGAVSATIGEACVTMLGGDSASARLASIATGSCEVAGGAGHGIVTEKPAGQICCAAEP